MAVRPTQDDPYRQWLDDEKGQDQEAQALQQAIGTGTGIQYTPPGGTYSQVPSEPEPEPQPPAAAPTSPTTGTGQVSPTYQQQALQQSLGGSPAEQAGWAQLLNSGQAYLPTTTTGYQSDVLQPLNTTTGATQAWSLTPNERDAWLRLLDSGQAYLPAGWTLNSNAQPMTARGGYADLEGNYGGYSAPQWMPATWGSVLPGWSQENWANVDMLTPKYVVGRILSNYDPSDPEQVKQAVADIQRAYPGSTWNGFDTVTIPGVGAIDIIAAAGGANPSWWWGALDSMPTGNTEAGRGASINALVGPEFNWSGMSPNDLLRMAMSRLAMNRVFWDNPMNTPW